MSTCLYGNIVVCFLVTCTKASHTLLRIAEYQICSYHKTYWKRQTLLKLCRNIKARIQMQHCWMADLGSPHAAPWSFGMRLWLLVLGIKPRRWCWIWCQDKEVPYLNLLYWLQDLKCQPTSARYFLLFLKFWGFTCNHSHLSVELWNSNCTLSSLACSATVSAHLAKNRKD